MLAKDKHWGVNLDAIFPIDMKVFRSEVKGGKPDMFTSQKYLDWLADRLTGQIITTKRLSDDNRVIHHVEVPFYNIVYYSIHLP